MSKKKLKASIPKFSFAYYILTGLRDIWLNIRNLSSYEKDYISFKKLSLGAKKRFEVTWDNRWPFMNDKTKETTFDNQYIYHPAWACRILAQTRPEFHIDISSTLHFCTMLSAFMPVKFYDYRPAQLTLSNLTSDRGDLLNLPFETSTVSSLSCMHTIEHVGLGRYGDPLDYDGDIKAINELIRVAKPGGDILFVIPLGKPMLRFNGLRIYSYEQICEFFKDCELKDFSLIPDEGAIINDASPSLVKDQTCGCGCFWFKKV